MTTWRWETGREERRRDNVPNVTTIKSNETIENLSFYYTYNLELLTGDQM